MIMVGYAKEYPVGTYRLYNPKTKRVVVSDSVQWTKFNRWNITPELEGVFDVAKNENKTGLETYDELGLSEMLQQHKMRLRTSRATETVLLADDDDTMEENLPALVPRAVPARTVVTDNASALALKPVVPLRRSARIEAKNKVADTPTAAPTPKSTITDGINKVTGDTSVRPIILDEGVALIENKNKGDATGENVYFIFNTSINSDPGEPTSVHEALAGKESKWWTSSSISEVNNFLSRNAWKFVLKSNIGNRLLVGTKVVFKKKDEPDGTKRFKTRILTLGYMQIPGVDYTEKFSPVAKDSSIRIVFALVLYYYDSHGWRTKRIDIEAAFLEGDLEVPMFLKIPDIMVKLGFLTKEQQEQYCIDLQSGMYGNVDAALRFFVKLIQCLMSDDVGMKQS